MYRVRAFSLSRGLRLREIPHNKEPAAQNQNSVSECVPNPRHEFSPHSLVSLHDDHRLRRPGRSEGNRRGIFSRPLSLIAPRPQQLSL